MNGGDWVQVRAYGGQVLKRRVVSTTDSLVYVVSDAEYRAAEVEGREPNAVGFYREAIIGQTEAD